MTTFERYFIADKKTHEEIKNPYYSLIGGGELCISALSVVNTVEQFIVSTASGINQAAAE